MQEEELERYSKNRLLMMQDENSRVEEEPEINFGSNEVTEQQKTDLQGGSS